MAKHQGSEDVNETAFRVMQQATGEIPRDERKSPSAVVVGRAGGIVGAPARAAKLTPEERSAIARKAAEARWNK